jgi:lipopolysaccharide cholinephosphotransferase
MERQLELREVQEVLLQMLVAFAGYCDRYGLRYYLVGGTLLGAVRHKGFIPWDDDIDVGMPRPDYERFLSLVETEPVAEEYQVISAREHTLSLPFAEMIHQNSRLERPTSRYIDGDFRQLHLFLDIFPQDGWPEDDKEARQLVRRTNFLRKLSTESRATIGAGTNLYKRIAKIPAILLGRAIGTETINLHLDKIAQKYNYDLSKYVGAITYGIYGVGERCLREEIYPLQKVEFEGHVFYAPACTDSYLKGIFGDYMTLPPQEMQVSHGLAVWLKQTKLSEEQE